jgi:hypothetical protein
VCTRYYTRAQAAVEREAAERLVSLLRMPAGVDESGSGAGVTAEQLGRALGERAAKMSREQLRALEISLVSAACARGQEAAAVRACDVAVRV